MKEDKKRFTFTVAYDTPFFYDNDYPLEPKEVVDLLNEQDDELHKYRTENAELHITILENEKEIGEQQATINLLLDLLYQSEATVINEYSSNIGEDMEKLDRIFKEKDIKEIERFVRGCDDG